MATDYLNQPLVVIVGPTASGKSSLAIDTAKKYNGEIICADSRTIYKHMDIGTAKPTIAEQAGIPHWGLDIIEPDEVYSASDFKQYAQKKIIQIRSRGHLPILVGGSGLYVDSVIFDYKFGSKSDPINRGKFEEMSLNELYNYCIKYNIKLPENSKNKRYVIRSIEKNGTTSGRRVQPIENCIVVGIATDREKLRIRIKERSEQLFDGGVVNEAITLGEKYGWNTESMKGNIYQVIRQHIDDRSSLDDAKEKSVTLDWRLAKRQLTWFRRNSFIQWLALKEAKKYIASHIAK
jgi:tRNA dimethylallyltransferase